MALSSEPLLCSMRWRRRDAISTPVVERTYWNRALLASHDNIDWVLNCCYSIIDKNHQTASIAD